MEVRTTYFEKAGEANTDATLALAEKRAGELGIKTVLVASSRGITAVKAVDVFKGRKVVIVTHEYGHIEPNTTDFLDENRQIVESKGGKILTSVHGFGGINDAFSSRPSPLRRMEGYGVGTAGVAGSVPSAPAPVPGEIITRTLAIFCRGMKVAAEIVVMAADCGMVRTDEEVIAIAGSIRGADTAIVVQPANTNRFFQLKIKEIICKPRD